jgi:hypothetical protein
MNASSPFLTITRLLTFLMERMDTCIRLWVTCYSSFAELYFRSCLRHLSYHGLAATTACIHVMWPGRHESDLPDLPPALTSTMMIVVLSQAKVPTDSAESVGTVWAETSSRSMTTPLSPNFVLTHLHLLSSWLTRTSSQWLNPYVAGRLPPLP